MSPNATEPPSPKLQNLDEVAAPPPQDARKRRLRLGFSAEQIRSKLSLESRQERKNASKQSLSQAGAGPEQPDNYQNLDELAAPSPVDPAQERAEDHLEDRGQGRSAGEDEPGFSKLATEVYTVSYLILFSIFGTLARLGLQALTVYPSAPVQTGVLWANVGGSLVMGFLSEDRNLFREEWGRARDKKQVNGDVEKAQKREPRASEDKRHGTVKKSLPLYIGLATGFCGSFTSFSSFMRDTFYALANALPVPINHPSSAPISQTTDVHRNGGYSFMALLAVIITTIGLSLGALQVGAHLALALDPYTPSVPFLPMRRYVDRFVVFLAAGCWLAAVFMAIFPPDRPRGPVGNASWMQETWRSQALFAMVFAPPGCLLRFYASLHLNGKIKSFPLGTFTVNIFGTAMEAMFISLQKAPVGGMVGCQVLQGMSDGFCGCLTTVSTWVVELKGLRTRHSYVYGGTSVLTGLSLFIIIAGSLLWTQGFASSLCMN